ncbi:MAG: metallophosphoesterase [Myxococcales bacterium]|nr:metallophosphoesterase [Myxococcales bacterium]
MTRILALSDLHVGIEANRTTVAKLPAHPDDWLILGGDLGETEAHLRFVLSTVAPKYQRIFWVPGNHELWTSEDPALSGVAKYQRLVEVCREFSVLTPEDPWPTLPAQGEVPAIVVASLFLLYDYSFCPPGLGPEEAVAWAAEGGIVCADERRLRPDPFPTRQAWCAARLQETTARLDALQPHERTLLVNHWPLRLDLCRLFRIPRFTPWCGTRQTEDWHLRYRAEVVVSGHLHMRATDWRDGVRFEEVSLGYPRQYDPQKGAPGYLRQVWPPERAAPAANAGPHWVR